MKITSFMVGGKEDSQIRYAISDDDGKILDNAYGLGYKSQQSASKAMWYKFKGGKSKIQSERDKKKAFFKKHEGVEAYIQNMYDCYFKELARGERDEDDMLEEVNKEFGIDMPKSYLHLD